MARIIDIDVELPVFMRGGEQLQADWNQNDDTQPDYINNKPSIKAGAGNLSIAEGCKTIAGGLASHAEGGSTTASASYAHAEGFKSTASGYTSHAEGYNTTASSSFSHAEGNATTASSFYAHAEGKSTKASGYSSHAEGNGTKADGYADHAEGYGTTASGYSSHAEGYETTASGYHSHAEGLGTTAQRKSQHTFGEYNVLDSTGDTSSRGEFVEIVGNGTSTNDRSNARTLDWSGNEQIAGTLRIGSTSAGGALLKFESNTLKVSFDNGATWGTVQITF